MSVLLYLDNHYVESLDDLKQIIEKAELGTILFDEIHAAFSDDAIQDWLSEIGETQLLSNLQGINYKLPDDEFLAQLKGVFSGEAVKIEKPPFSRFASVKSIKLFADGKEIRKTDEDYFIKNHKGKLILDIEFDINESVNCIYSVSVSLEENGGRLLYNRTCQFNLHTKEKYSHIKFTIPAHDIGNTALLNVAIETHREPICISLVRIPKDAVWFDPETKELRFNGYVHKFVDVEGGSFQMGAPESDSEADGDEKPQHRVTVGSFAIGETQVTQALWKAVVEAWEKINGKSSTLQKDPSKFKGANRPVEFVSWDDCQYFIKILNELTGQKFSLPKEAEWEYAARGGKHSRNYKYSGSNTIDDVAWYDLNSGGQTHPVGEKRDNELGLYDMSGNVREWCEDWFDGNYYGKSESNNPTGPSHGSSRVFRGGGYYYGAGGCRVSYRNYDSPGYRDSALGLRLVLRS